MNKTKTKTKMKTINECNSITEELEQSHLEYMTEELNFDDEWIERNVIEFYDEGDLL